MGDDLQRSRGRVGEPRHADSRRLRSRGSRRCSAARSRPRWAWSTATRRCRSASRSSCSASAASASTSSSRRRWCRPIRSSRVDIVDSQAGMGAAGSAPRTRSIRRRPRTWRARFGEVVGSRGADVVVDTTGRARVIEAAYDAHARRRQDDPGRSAAEGRQHLHLLAAAAFQEGADRLAWRQRRTARGHPALRPPDAGRQDDARRTGDARVHARSR